MVPPDESILAVQGVAVGGRGSGLDLELQSPAPKVVRHSEDGDKGITSSVSEKTVGGQAKPEGEIPPELAKLVPQGTKVAIEKDDESGKMVVRIKDAVTGDVIKQLPPEEMLRIATSIEKYLGLLVDKRS